jgi:hypothetical protein
MFTYFLNEHIYNTKPISLDSPRIVFLFYLFGNTLDNWVWLILDQNRINLILSRMSINLTLNQLNASRNMIVIHITTHD